MGYIETLINQIWGDEPNDFHRKSTRDIHIANAEQRFENGMKYYLGDDKYKFVDGYEMIWDWMSNNLGKGLTLIGPTGVGKSIIATKILPLLIKDTYRDLRTPPVYTAYDLNKPDEYNYMISETYIQVIDDFGIEPMCNIYGQKQFVFNEIVFEAERKGTMLILTTNLSPAEIQARYGARTLDRLKGITKLCPIYGDSMRG